MSALVVEDLQVQIPGPDREPITIVSEIGMRVEPGRILGIAGESGSGKTISSLAVMGLLPRGSRVTGSILLGGTELVGMRESQLRGLRGRRVAMVFQDPLSSLHPMLTIGAQMTDHMRRHLGLNRSDATRKAADLLGRVRLPNPQKLVDVYPHQLSGGMRQRVAIAIALACDPQVLIADEPTTALDVTVQAGILELFDQLRSEIGIATVVITHDLGVLSSIADDMVVFQSGRIVESGPSGELFTAPKHPYTRTMLAALSTVTRDEQSTPERR
ncbi:MAG TPA: ABC transporter ATP-binding protein [Pseudolysinimonas sp.]|nr:ABC transporter ATP-binding protein [Pseudolysinimonas sp.]